jgi:ribose-phosphate pyrophosphokinase
MKAPGCLQIFALESTAEFGAQVAHGIGLKLSHLEERTFEDGEYKLRPLDSVSGDDIYVVQSLHAGPTLSADDKLNRLLFFIAALKDAGAVRVTAVTPYLCYARKDRRTKWQDPLTLGYVARLFEALAADRIVTIDVHNDAAFENAFRCRTINLTAVPLYVQYVKELHEEKLCVVSPDPGGVKRAEFFREALEAACGFPVTKGIVDKHRSEGRVTGELFAGDVSNRTALILDDLISSGGTLLRAAKAARANGAKRVIALATHGLFMSGATESLSDPAIERIVVTDCVPGFRIGEHAVRLKIDTLPAAQLFSDAVGRLHEERDLRDLLVF